MARKVALFFQELESLWGVWTVGCRSTGLASSRHCCCNQPWYLPSATSGEQRPTETTVMEERLVIVGGE